MSAYSGCCSFPNLDSSAICSCIFFSVIFSNHCPSNIIPSCSPRPSSSYRLRLYHVRNFQLSLCRHTFYTAKPYQLPSLDHLYHWKINIPSSLLRSHSYVPSECTWGDYGCWHRMISYLIKTFCWNLMVDDKNKHKNHM